MTTSRKIAEFQRESAKEYYKEIYEPLSRDEQQVLLKTMLTAPKDSDERNEAKDKLIVGSMRLIMKRFLEKLMWAEKFGLTNGINPESAFHSVVAAIVEEFSRAATAAGSGNFKLTTAVIVRTLSRTHDKLTNLQRHRSRFRREADFGEDVQSFSKQETMLHFQGCKWTVPEYRAMAADVSDCVRELLDEMEDKPMEQLAMLAVHFSDESRCGLPLSEIARMEGVSETTLRDAYRRAKERTRKQLEADGS